MKLAWTLVAVAGVALTLGVSAAQAADKKANVKIVNNSDWEIHELYVSPAGPGDDWGPDQLQKNVIKAKGGTFTLQQIPCDTYDVKLVDEDGDACEVDKVDICGGSDTWTIASDALLKCQKNSE